MQLSFILPALAFAFPQAPAQPQALQPQSEVAAASNASGSLHAAQGKQMPVNFCFVCGGGCGGGCFCGMDTGCNNGGNNGNNGGNNCPTGQCDGNGPIIIGGGGANAYRIALNPLQSLLRQQQELRGMLTGLASH